MGTVSEMECEMTGIVWTEVIVVEDIENENEKDVKESRSVGQSGRGGKKQKRNQVFGKGKERME